MSASETNLAKQKRRHVGPLVGMAAVVLFALGLLFWWLSHEAAVAPGPQGETTAPAAPTQTQEVAPTAPGTMAPTGTPTAPAAPGAVPQATQPVAPVTPPQPAPAN